MCCLFCRFVMFKTCRLHPPTFNPNGLRVAGLLVTAEQPGLLAAWLHFQAGCPAWASGILLSCSLSSFVVVVVVVEVVVVVVLLLLLLLPGLPAACLRKSLRRDFARRSSRTRQRPQKSDETSAPSGARGPDASCRPPSREPLFGADCQTIRLPLHRRALDKLSFHRGSTHVVGCRPCSGALPFSLTPSPHPDGQAAQACASPDPSRAGSLCRAASACESEVHE